jgi:hypothetical protein
LVIFGYFDGIGFMVILIGVYFFGWGILVFEKLMVLL